MNNSWEISRNFIFKLFSKFFSLPGLIVTAYTSLLLC